MFLCSMQCAKHEVDNVFVAGFIIQLCTDMAADIGHFNPFYAIMHQLGSHVNIVYSEHAFLHSFAQYIFEQQYLLGIKRLRTFSTRQMSRKKLARSVPLRNTTSFTASRRVYIISIIFSSGDIFFSATRFIMSESISSSDSTTAI